MTRSLILALYLALAGRADGAAHRRLARRLTEGKEDPDRLGERFGQAGLPRPAGRLVWFHAASVGEMLSLFELIRRLGEAAPDAHFLVTTGTLTSAKLFAARAPSRSLHQFAPVDTRRAVRAFLDHWRPDVAVWAESELWPTMLCETHARGVPMLLVNARMSERSARRWRLLRGAAKSLLRRFELLLAQDDATADALRRLGAPAARVEVTGTLKEGAAPLPCDEAERARLAAAIAGRPVWLAASTHPGEEAAALAAHRK
ncbi:MAG: 3-deoxy-D-manno-octulosonic acid transferase, partial [Alphaproteobacteria bacterium]